MKLTEFAKIIVIAGAMAVPFIAGAKSSIEKYHEEIAEMSIDANLVSPDVPRKFSEQVKGRMADLCARLRKANLDADTNERGGLVTVVTIPVAEIFAPNDTLVAPFGVKPLMTLSRHMKVADYYKVLVAVHSDDTGNEEYLNKLTTSRADAIVNWLEDQGIKTEGVIPYGMGFDEPLSVDPSRAARAQNRRIEIYFVPGPVMIENIKSGR